MVNQTVASGAVCVARQEVYPSLVDESRPTPWCIFIFSRYANQVFLFVVTYAVYHISRLMASIRNYHFLVPKKAVSACKEFNTSTESSCFRCVDHELWFEVPTMPTMFGRPQLALMPSRMSCPRETPSLGEDNHNVGASVHDLGLVTSLVTTQGCNGRFSPHPPSLLKDVSRGAKLPRVLRGGWVVVFVMHGVRQATHLG